jgi:hypothetical protein
MIATRVPNPDAADGEAVATGGGSLSDAVVTTNTDYYVRTDGSDTSTGLANTAAGAFRTVQAAVDYVTQNYIVPSNTITINVGVGTFAEAVLIRYYLGMGTMVIKGAGASSTTITSISSFAGGVQVQALKLSGGVDCVRATACGSVVINSGVEFGTASNAHIMAYLGGVVEVRSNNYVVSGNAAYHYQALNGGLITAMSSAVTLGTRTFSVFAFLHMGGQIDTTGMTYSGSVTGQRYNGNMLSMFYVAGGGSTYFPGSVVGAVSNGSVYA